MASDGRLRQAVVVIHGVGEQRPMTTLRRFTSAAMAPNEIEPGFASEEAPEKLEPRYASHPDRYADTLELFTLRAPPRSAGDSVPVTDFFECHWAHRMRDTRLGQVWWWLFKLLVTRPKRNTRVYAAYWAILTAIVALSAIVAIVLFLYPSLSQWFLMAWGLGGVIVIAVLVVLLRRYVGGYVGDAARYLTPSPDNLAERAEIRKLAIDLLERVHREGKYQRIVVVGHSLGSVIAYDVVSRLWDRYRQDQRTDAETQPCLEDLEVSGPALREVAEHLQTAESDLRRGSRSHREEYLDAVDHWRGTLKSERKEYRKKQLQLWKEQQQLGNPWRITDLITFGSPLTHADYLLRAAGDPEWGLVERKLAREFSTCPPLADNWKREPEQYAPANKEESIAYRPVGEYTRVIVPSALFAFVRWTNLYFPGDLIGGPLAPEFGYGIEDIELRRFVTHNRRNLRASWSPLSHTKYWAALGPEERAEDAVTRKLREVLALETEETKDLLDEVRTMS